MRERTWRPVLREDHECLRHFQNSRVPRRAILLCVKLCSCSVPYLSAL